MGIAHENPASKRPCLLLTGANGFLGEATIRQWGGRGKVYALVRGRGGQSATERFDPVAERIRSDGIDVECIVLSCNLSDECLGLRGDVLARVLSEVSHVVNCAGNVRFDLTPSDAIANNVKTAVNVAHFATRCERISEGRLVHVSTAYVSPPQPSGGLEKPEISAIEIGYPATKEHHHNTYTWSKCIAEHCVVAVANESNIFLSIIRPSMIGPAWMSTFPGWCPGHSSPTQSVGMLYGSGVLRVLQPNGVLNIVPVDWVAKMTIDALFRAGVIEFYTATVPPSYAYPLSDAAEDAEKYRFYESFNSHPSCQYRATKVLVANGVLARALELILEDSHALVLKIMGQKKAYKLFMRALKSRDLALKPYGAQAWAFDPHKEMGLELWPETPSHFSEKYARICIESAAATLRERKKRTPSKPRVGNWIDGIIFTSLFTITTGICYAMACIPAVNLPSLFY